MNTQAALGSGSNVIFVGSPPHPVPASPSFIDFEPDQFLGRFDARDAA